MHLSHYAGTEIVVRDLALGLQAAGHHPMVYSPLPGKIAADIALTGIPVVADLRHLPLKPDIIHGHHFIQTLEALAHFPHTPGIYVCHDRLHWNDTPPGLNRLKRYVAVDYNCRERLTEEAQVPLDLVRVIYNTVDLDRFQPRPPLPDKPRRALIFSNYAGANTHMEPIQAACAALNLPVDMMGLNSANLQSQPEQLLGQYDLIFAKARCALEAMAVGAAVVLCDTRGLGPLVTAAEVEQLRPWNFGMRLLQQPLEPEQIIAQIKRYNPEDAAVVSRYIRKQADLRLGLKQYLQLYEEVLTEWQNEPALPPDDPQIYLNLALTKLEELGSQMGQIKSERTYYYNQVNRLQTEAAHLHQIIREKWERADHLHQVVREQAEMVNHLHQVARERQEIRVHL